MADNRITVTFTACSPMPDFGFNIQYRILGSSDAYRDGGNFTSSPAVINDTSDPAGTRYEGYIRADCGGGNFGPQVAFDSGH